MEREAKDRYTIPDSLIKPKSTPEHAVEDVHREILTRKYNLQTLSKIYKELDEDYLKCHKQIIFDS